MPMPSTVPAVVMGLAFTAISPAQSIAQRRRSNEGQNCGQQIKPEPVASDGLPDLLPGAAIAYRTCPSLSRQRKHEYPHEK
jgi:hypothetical protein